MNADFSDPAKCDPRLQHRIWTTAEMEYMTRLAMEGLRRVFKQNGFTRAAAAERAMREYRQLNDPVAEWLDENEVTDRSTSECFSRFSIWNELRNNKKIAFQTFTKRVLQCRTDIETQQRRVLCCDGSRDRERYFVRKAP